MKTIAIKFIDKQQIIEIPSEFEFGDVSEVLIERQGDSLVLTPVKKSWKSLANNEKSNDDFLVERPKVF